VEVGVGGSVGGVQVLAGVVRRRTRRERRKRVKVRVRVVVVAISLRGVELGWLIGRERGREEGRCKWRLPCGE